MAAVVVTPLESSGTALARYGFRGQVARFAVIGAGSTVLHLSLLAVLTGPLGVQVANLVGLVISTVANTAANRAWTFEIGAEAAGFEPARGVIPNPLSRRAH